MQCRGKAGGVKLIKNFSELKTGAKKNEGKFLLLIRQRRQRVKRCMLKTEWHKNFIYLA